MKYCSTIECHRPHVARGYCRTHYGRALKKKEFAPIHVSDRRRVTGGDADFVVRRYELGDSENMLANDLGVSRSAIRRALIERGVPIRGQTAAIRLMMSKRTPEENRRNSEAAHEAARKHIHTQEEKLKRALTRERLGLHTSPIEAELSERLRARGLIPYQQRSIGIYNSDIVINDVVIEVYGGSWHTATRHAERSTRRFKYILENGYDVIILWIDKDKYPLSKTAVDYIEDFIRDERQPDPVGGKFRVIVGDGCETSRGDADLALLSSLPKHNRHS